MRSFAEKSKATQQTTSVKSTISNRAHFGQSRDVNSIPHLQRTIGNQALQRLLQSNAENLNAVLTPASSSHFGHDFRRIPISPPTTEAIQTKPAINKPRDEYEREADRAAERVMLTPELRSQQPEGFLSSAEIEPFIPPNNSINPSENLRSERFAGNPRLEAAYDNAPPMRKGEVGEAVALVQETLVDDGFDMPISTKENGEMDGIFGSETFRTVWAFQEKHDLDSDGVVGHDTLDEMQVVEENKEEKPEEAQLGCPGIKKFGIDIAGSVSVVVHKHFPFADTRGGSPNDIMFHTAGRSVTNSLFEINALAIDGTSLTGVNANVEHGIIQTARIMRFDGEYGGGHKAHRISSNSRDAENDKVRQPWVRSSGATGSPRSLGDPFQLLDAPRHHLPMEHPKHAGSNLERIKFKTVFDFWHVAKEKSSDGTKQSNLAFLSRFQITSESEAVKAKNNKFVGSQPNNRIAQPIQCGQGSATPVLDTPITIDDLTRSTT